MLSRASAGIRALSANLKHAKPPSEVFEHYAAVDRACYERAQTLLDEGITLYKRHGAQTEIAFCLEAFAALAGGTGRPERAVWLWGAAAALRETLVYPGG